MIATIPSNSNPSLAYEIRFDSHACAIYCTCPGWRLQRMKPSASMRSCSHIARFSARLLAGGMDIEALDLDADACASMAGKLLGASKPQRGDAIRAAVAHTMVVSRAKGWERHATWALENPRVSANLKRIALAALAEAEGE